MRTQTGRENGMMGPTHATPTVIISGSIIPIDTFMPSPCLIILEEISTQNNTLILCHEKTQVLCNHNITVMCNSVQILLNI